MCAGYTAYAWTVTNSPAANRLRLALDMYEFGERMQRTRLRRLHPQASDTQIDAGIRAWLASRRTARSSDAVGKPSSRFA